MSNKIAQSPSLIDIAFAKLYFMNLFAGKQKFSSYFEATTAMPMLGGIVEKLDYEELEYLTQKIEDKL